MNVFFVCGSPKSGTTWIQRILDAHPQMSCSGEGHFIERFAGPVANIVNEYNQQLAIEAREVYQGRPYYAPMSQAEYDALMRAFVMQRLTSRGPAPEVSWVGDKTPRYTLNLPDLHRIFPAARFVHVLRDPRDVAASRLAHNHRVGVPNVLTPGAAENREQIRLAIESWVQAVSAAAAFTDQHSHLVHEVRYGDLHRDPAGELARLFGFFGVAADAGLVAQVVEASSFEAMSGGRKRGEEDLSSFYRKGLPDAWSDHLDPEGAAMVMDACGELMRRKGLA